MFCSNCGNKLPDNAKFCGNCGERVDQVPDNQPVLDNQPRQAVTSNIRYQTEKNRKLIAIALFCLTTAIELFFLWSLCFTQLSSAKGFFSYDAAAKFADRYNSSSWSSDSFGYLSNGLFDRFYSVASSKIWNDYQGWFIFCAIVITGLTLIVGYKLYYECYKSRTFDTSRRDIPLVFSILRIVLYLILYFCISAAIHNNEYGTYINCSGLLVFIIFTGIANIVSGAVYHNAANWEYSNKYKERQNQYQAEKYNS